MKYSIGIDIGATKIKGVIASEKGRIFAWREIETRVKRKRAKILGDIIGVANFFKKIAENKHFKIVGINVSVPGKIKNGKLIFGGGTLKQLIGSNLKNLIQQKTGLKTIIENDSVAFAFAESYFGAAKKYNRVAGVIWGSGIGSGIVDKKQRSRTSLEIGHLVVGLNIKTEPKDACGARGCVENLASGKNIVRRYYAKGGKIKNAGVKEIYHSKECVAKKVLEDAYKYLGMAIAALIHATKPDIVVIGGGVSNLPEPAHDKIKKYIYDYLPKRVKDLKIEKSKLGEYAGAFGAAMLILQK